MRTTAAAAAAAVPVAIWNAGSCYGPGMDDYPPAVAVAGEGGVWRPCGSLHPGRGGLTAPPHPGDWRWRRAVGVVERGAGGLGWLRGW